MQDDNLKKLEDDLQGIKQESQVPQVPEPQTSEAVNQPVAPPAMHEVPQKKSFLSKLATFLLFVAILSLISYFLGTKYLAQKPAAVSTEVPTSTPDPTANWKEYANEKMNIVFRYPTTPNLQVFLQPTNEFVLSLNESQYGPLFFEVSFLKNTDLDTWYKFAYKSSGINLPTAPQLKNGPSVDGIDSYFADFDLAGFGKIRYVFIQKGKDLYVIYIPIDNNKTQYQILSTFKFLDRTSDTEQIKTATTNYLVLIGHDKNKLKITDVLPLGNYTDKYIVSWIPGADYVGGGLSLLVGKVNGEWIIPNSGDSNYCDWIKNSGIDEATKAFMGPACNF